MPGIWRIEDVDRENPLPAETGFRNTWLEHTPHSSTNVTQIRERGGARPHIHERHDEIMCVVRGEGEFRLGDEVRQVKPGDVIVAPAGTVHGPTANSPYFVFLSVFAPEFDPANPDRVFVE
ncbi:MAG TPA: cupin domain-containing protein [Dehalococcoidia bacterium]|nr:cupin domain-containing protein [Dehalococcoidia bacterium]